MTKTFDALLESMLAEMMPASMMDDFGPEVMTAATNKKIENLPGKSQHLGPLQKLSAGDRVRIIRAIINNIFTEKGNTYTPMADDKDQLKELIKSAIIKVAKNTALSKSETGGPDFKAGGKWAVQFLADRLANEELLGKVKYTTEGGKEIKKDVTQKEMKAALNAALADTKGQSVWKRSAESEEASFAKKAAKAPVAAPKAADEKPEVNTEMETVYFKVKGFNTDDEVLQKAYDKLPEDKDMSWKEICKLVKASVGDQLLTAGGLGEEEREIEAGEDTEIGDLDVETNDADLSSFDKAAKMLNPYGGDTRGSFDKFHGDY